MNKRKINTNTPLILHSIISLNEKSKIFEASNSISQILYDKGIPLLL